MYMYLLRNVSHIGMYMYSVVRVCRIAQSQRVSIIEDFINDNMIAALYVKRAMFAVSNIINRFGIQ